MKSTFLLFAVCILGVVGVMEYNKNKQRQEEEYRKSLQRKYYPWVSYDIENLEKRKSYLDKLLSDN